MTEIFKSLFSEAQFTKEILVSGVHDIQKANYGRKGVYFQAFTSNIVYIIYRLHEEQTITQSVP